MLLTMTRYIDANPSEVSERLGHAVEAGREAAMRRTNDAAAAPLSQVAVQVEGDAGLSEVKVSVPVGENVASQTVLAINAFTTTLADHVRAA